MGNAIILLSMGPAQIVFLVPQHTSNTCCIREVASSNPLPTDLVKQREAAALNSVTAFVAHIVHLTTERLGAYAGRASHPLRRLLVTACWHLEQHVSPHSRYAYHPEAEKAGQIRPVRFSAASLIAVRR